MGPWSAIRFQGQHMLNILTEIILDNLCFDKKNYMYIFKSENIFGQKWCLYKYFWRENFLVERKFFSKKNVVKKNLVIENILERKKFWSKKVLVNEKCFARKIWLKNVLVEKKSWQDKC